MSSGKKILEDNRRSMEKRASKTWKEFQKYGKKNVKLGKRREMWRKD